MGDFVLRKMDLIIGRISALESGRASTDFVNKLREDLNLRTQDLAAMSKRDCDRADAVSSINEQMTRAFGRIISLESRPSVSIVGLIAALSTDGALRQAVKNTIAPELQSISKWLRDLEARSAGGALAGASSVRSAWRSTWPDGVKVRKAIEELARKIAAKIVAFEEQGRRVVVTGWGSDGTTNEGVIRDAIQAVLTEHITAPRVAGTGVEVVI